MAKKKGQVQKTKDTGSILDKEHNESRSMPEKVRREDKPHNESPHE